MLLTADLLKNSDAYSVALILDTIRDAPNDVRRVMFQTLASLVEEERAETAISDSTVTTVYTLIEAIETFLRTALKLQSSKPLSISHSRPAIDITTLPTTALRATAAALRTLHGLIRILPKREEIPLRSSAGKHFSLFSLFEILLPCLSAGLQAPRHSIGAIPRLSSNMQAGAFAWTQTSARSRRTPLTTTKEHDPTRTTASSSPTRNAAVSASRDSDYSSSGETEQESNKSESERSDFSTASKASIPSRIRKDESRQQEVMTKLIRQNALHCLIELNRHEARALVSRWSELLPDTPAPRPTTASAVPRPSSSFSSAASFSLCTLITHDPFTTVRIAAMSALESILLHGTQQFSIAQERNQPALSFTSLSSQLAVWVVNIRSHLLLALQRAGSAAGAEAAGNVPSSFATRLLQLTRTFVVCTAKAKLVTSNAAVLGPISVGFASQNDPDVQKAAKRLIATLTPKSSGSPTSDGSKQKMDTAFLASVADPLVLGDPIVLTPTANAPSAGIANLLNERDELTIQVCEQVLSSFDGSEAFLEQLPTWSLLVKRLADAPVPLLDSKACARLLRGWTGLTNASTASPDQRCNVLATVPDLYKVLSKHSAFDAPTSPNILEYIEACCRDADEAVRAAAVRVLGLLVLPSDIGLARTSLMEAPVQTAVDSKPSECVTELLRHTLWGKSDTLPGGTLHDNSSLVRQRAAWAFSNAVDARLRSASFLDEPEWLVHAQNCLELGHDIAGVAVSAFRASGSLLAMIPATASTEVYSLGRDLVEQLCMVLSSTTQPPKSRWNAASALERALGSELVFSPVLQPLLPLSDRPLLLDRSVELLCSNLTAKVFKVRVSAANALLSLCIGEAKSQESDRNAERTKLLGAARCTRIQACAAARLCELAEAPPSKASALYVEELKGLLHRLVAACSCPATA